MSYLIIEDIFDINKFNIINIDFLTKNEWKKIITNYNNDSKSKNKEELKGYGDVIEVYSQKGFKNFEEIKEAEKIKFKIRYNKGINKRILI